MSRNGLLLLLLAALAIAGYALWFVQNFERRTEEVRTAPAAEARRNPLLAAERFLARLGHDVHSEHGNERLRNPPPGDAFLVVRGPRPPLNRQQRERLQEWVEAGGHLLLDVEPLWDSRTGVLRSPWLAGLGLRLAERETRRQGPVSFGFESEAELIEVDFNRRLVLFDDSDAASARISDEWGSALVQYRLGEGKVTLVADLDFLSNERISEADHAYFLAGMAASSDQVWLLHDLQVESLWDLLWRTAAPALMTGLALLGLWLWRSGARFGPLCESPVAGQRDLRLYSKARARFVLRVGDPGQLLLARRTRALARLRQRYPALHNRDDEGISLWLAEHLHLDLSGVRRALFGETGDPREFVAMTARLQQLDSRNPAGQPESASRRPIETRDQGQGSRKA